VDERRKKWIKILLVPLSLWIFITGIGYVWGWSISRIQETRTFEPNPAQLNALRAESALLHKKIQALLPRGVYIAVDTAGNMLYLREGERTLLSAIISAGSGTVLKNPADDRQWVFETPRGEFTVLSKFTKPTWIKPDWAFIEEGKPIPTKFNDRVETGVLGDFALGLGNGYFIHGTLYTRLLGKNITHGCIRVGDKDLRTLYKTVPLGTKVFIF
jgi:lipoprotein-anchoring transpeptidase ErfK/SrfK